MSRIFKHLEAGCLQVNYMQGRIQDLSLGGVECEAPKASRNEVPKALRGWGGVLGREWWGLGRGDAPPQEFFVKFTLNSLILQRFVRITTV